MIREADASKTAGDNPLLHVLRAGGYSIHGLGSALRHEMAFRIEAACVLLLLPVAILLPVGILFKALLISSMLLVLIVELLNSAIEWVVDYISLERHPFAKRAKDMGSAAVMLCLINSGMMWLLGLAAWQQWLS